MKLRCRANVGSALAEEQRPRGENAQTRYDLTPGKDYSILGMILWENVLALLVADDWGGPGFFPAGLFEREAAQLPSDWHFGVLAGIAATGRGLWEQPLQAVWGYPELVEDQGHIDGLGNREAESLSVFRAQQEKVEAESPPL